MERREYLLLDWKSLYIHCQIPFKKMREQICSFLVM